MKRVIILWVVNFVWLLSLTAHPVDQETARIVATNFMGTSDLHLSTTFQTDHNEIALYVFNTKNGFVIVSADDCETPIIAYSHEGCFDPNNVPVQMEDYLQNFAVRIQYGIDNQIIADEQTAKQWELVKSTGRLNDGKHQKTVEPLITAQWHQGCLYNSLCPAMENAPCEHAKVGCVAIAMGQIMHYWGYPDNGWGSHSFYNGGTELSANFGGTVYEWNLMPDSLTDTSSEAEIEAIATLLYHCGISVDMQYNNGGSAAESDAVPNALIRYFNYSRHLHGEWQSHYSNEEWLSLLKHCLDSKCPVYYSGHGNVGGHAFVCDGYDSNDLLHFNWGWGGSGNGYFALGNLNPLGYGFNNGNYAIFDINPQYEPWTVSASTNPPMAGIVDGVGTYHIGETCTLTAVPARSAEFSHWIKDGNIISYETSVSFEVETDINDIEAVFSHLPIKEIRLCYASETRGSSDTCISLSWLCESTEWTCLNWFPITSVPGGGVATDGEYIYVSNYYGAHTYPCFMFEKYTMDGEFVEVFDIDPPVFAPNLTYDGNYFYCSSSGNLNKLYCVDLANKTLIDITELENNKKFKVCAYDPIHDGFWILTDGPIKLIDRQGQMVFSGLQVPSDALLGGMGFITAKDGTQHLLLAYRGSVFDYNITNNDFINHPLAHTLVAPYEIGASIGKYDGKDAFFVHTSNSISIYEIKSTLAQITGYRLYRAKEGGDTIMLSDGYEGLSYTDSTWASASAGVYRYGICSVFANGVESEIVWSDTIEKTGHGIEEHKDSGDQGIQKVFENGQIIIIKDGKRYNVAGQQVK